MMADEQCPKCAATMTVMARPGSYETPIHVHDEGGKNCLERQLTQLRAENERLQGLVDTDVAAAYEHCRQIAANRIDEGSGDGWAAACTIIAATIVVQARERARQAAEAAAKEDGATPQGQGEST